MMLRTLIVIPTYNEADSIESLLASLRTVVDADVLIVDDGSPDDTAGSAERMREQLGGIFVLQRGRKLGLGSAYRAGFAWGIERGYDVLLGMDADLSHDPLVVPQLLAELESADLVIGSRYVAGGSTPDWPLHRRLLSRTANRYAGWMLRHPVRDLTSGFRAYRAELLVKLDFANLRAEGYAFLVEATDLACGIGATVVEVPIAFRDRRHGKSKMSARVIAESIVLVTIWGAQRRARSLARGAARRQ